MSYSLLRQDEKYVNDGAGEYMEFVCDVSNDIKDLPTGIGVKTLNKPRPGSTAVVIETGDVWILSNARKWAVIIRGDLI